MSIDHLLPWTRLVMPRFATVSWLRDGTRIHVRGWTHFTHVAAYGSLPVAHVYCGLWSGSLWMCVHLAPNNGQVPEGKGPGDTCEIVLASGRTIKVTVPEGKVRTVAALLACTSARASLLL